MTAVTQSGWMPREFRHPGNRALALTTRIRCGSGDDNPPMAVSFLVAGEWTPEFDWWRFVQEPDYCPDAVAANLDRAGREELEARGWELLAALGYIPSAWSEESSDAFA